MSWRATFSPLARAGFRWYYASVFANLLGSSMAGVALVFAVLDLGHSASALGVVLAARTIPLVVLLLFGGVLADRLPRATVLVFSNVLSAVTQGTVAALVLTGTAQLWTIALLEVVNGAVSAVSMPTEAAMVPSLVAREELQQANALMSLSRGGLRILGPTLGALLVVTVGSGWTLAFDALSWAVAALLLARVSVPPREAPAEATSTWFELREGWTLVRTTTWLWVVVAAFAGINMIQAGAWSTLGPVVAEHTIGRQGWGLVLSAQAAGFLAATVVMLRVRLTRPLLMGMLGVALFGLPIALLGLSATLVVLLVVGFVSGCGTEVFVIGWDLAMQENIEERMLSRAYSYDMLGSLVAVPVGQLVFGPLGDAYGAREVMVVAGIGYAVISLATLVSRPVRLMSRATVPTAA